MTKFNNKGFYFNRNKSGAQKAKRSSKPQRDNDEIPWILKPDGSCRFRVVNTLEDRKIFGDKAEAFKRYLRSTYEKTATWLDTKVKTTVRMPAPPTDPNDEYQKLKYKAEFSAAFNLKQTFESEWLKQFADLRNIIDPPLEVVLRNDPQWEVVTTSQDVVGLFTLITRVCSSDYKGNVSCNSHQNAMRLMSEWYKTVQFEDETDANFLTRYVNTLNLLRDHGINPIPQGVPLLFKDARSDSDVVDDRDEDNDTPEQLKKKNERIDAELEEIYQEQQNESDERWFAMDFICNRVCYKRHKKAIDQLRNRDNAKSDEYPKSLNDAVAYLNNFQTMEESKSSSNTTRQHHGESSSSSERPANKVFFTKKQGGNKGGSKNKQVNFGGTKSHATSNNGCSHCGYTNHTSDSCRFKKNVEQQRASGKLLAFCQIEPGSTSDDEHVLTHHGGASSAQGDGLFCAPDYNNIMGKYVYGCNYEHEGPDENQVIIDAYPHNNYNNFGHIVEMSAGSLLQCSALDDTMYMTDEDAAKVLMSLVPSKSSCSSQSLLSLDQMLGEATHSSNIKGDDLSCGNVPETTLDSKIVLQLTYAKENDIYMDSGSQCNLTPHRELLVNVRKAKVPLRINGVAGNTVAHEIGEIGQLSFYVCKEVPVTILSLAKCSKKFRVQFDSANGRGFEVYTKAGICRFAPKNDCFVFNMKDERYAFTLLTRTRSMTVPDTDGVMVTSGKHVEESVLDESKLQTADEDAPIEEFVVKSYKDKLSKDEIRRMKEAYDLFLQFGGPSIKTFKYILSHNRILGIDLTPRDWDNYLKSYGLPPCVVKGRMVRRGASAITSLDLGIKYEGTHITLSGDLMFTCTLIYLITVSDGIDYIICTEVSSKKKSALSDAIAQQCAFYLRQGYHVTELLFDGESAAKALSTLDDWHVQSCNIRLAPKGAHVPKAERNIRLIKERMRVIGNSLPYDISELLHKYLVKFVVGCINLIPRKGKHLSAYELLNGRSMNYKHFIGARFGQYCLIPIMNELKTNTMQARACGAICLGPVFENATPGSFAFLTIQTLRVVYRTNFVKQEMNDVVMERLNRMAKHYCQDFKVSDKKYDTYPSSDEEYDSNDEGEVAPTPVRHKELEKRMADLSPPFQVTGQKRSISDVHHESGFSSTSFPSPPTAADSTGTIINLDNRADSANRRGVVSGGTSGSDITVAPRRYDLRNSGQRSKVNTSLLTGTSYNEVFDNDVLDDEHVLNHQEMDCNDDLSDCESDGVIFFTEDSRPSSDMGNESVTKELPDSNDINDIVFKQTSTKSSATTLYVVTKDEASKLKNPLYFIPAAVVLVTLATQLSVKKGLEAWGDNAHNAVIDELRQMHDKNVLEPLDFDKLCKEDQRKVLRTLMFLKIKRDGRVKARLCMDGRLQALYITEDFASPTVSTESVLTTAAIDAHEERVVVCVDIEGAYLAVNMVDNVYGCFDENISRMYCSMYPNKYEGMIRNGKLYFRLVKALYGCVQSALLFYRHLRKSLEDFGFKTNEYDPCVFTRNFGDKQCTICTHVDDLKISCADPDAVEAVLTELERVYKKITIHRGPVLDYLGMELNYSNRGTVVISMVKSIEATLLEHGITSEGNAKTPASNNLFAIDATATKLDKARHERFHSIVAKLLYIAKHGRPDILLPISFLTTRVTEPTTQDETKLDRVLKYLYGTKELCLTLHISEIRIINAYIDASFGTHHDFKGHTGTMITLGKGAIFARSAKQKIVCKSSTESELVGLSDSLTPVIWLRNFIMALGYTMEASVVHQDNKSTIVLAEKGRSTSQRTRHMSIKYFYVKDRIDSKEIKVQHTGTEEMIADFFTKPLQGALFFKFRDLVMNANTPSNQLQGCVEDNE